MCKNASRVQRSWLKERQITNQTNATFLLDAPRLWCITTDIWLYCHGKCFSNPHWCIYICWNIFFSSPFMKVSSILPLILFIWIHWQCQGVSRGCSPPKLPEVFTILSTLLPLYLENGLYISIFLISKGDNERDFSKENRIRPLVVLAYSFCSLILGLGVCC